MTQISVGQFRNLQDKYGLCTRNATIVNGTEHWNCGDVYVIRESLGNGRYAYWVK